MTRRTKKYMLRKKRSMVWQYIGNDKPTGLQYGEYNIKMRDTPIGYRRSIWNKTGWEKRDIVGEWVECEDPGIRELVITKNQ